MVRQLRNKIYETAEKRERALLVGVRRPHQDWSVKSSLDELSRLTQTAGADPVGIEVQFLEAPNPRTFIGTGKAAEIAERVHIEEIDAVIFDDELSPSQQSNLERIVGEPVKVLDRTALILDIFALHATTREGRLQVRLAQNKYLYPRLRGMWAHLASNRIGGGVGSRFGEGESQLEVDRRMVRKRITSIKRELSHLEQIRMVQRGERSESSITKIALAGYTNAGKSSLLNRLCNADVLSYDKLFATLDSTTRKLKLPEGREVTCTDTVGFIRKLPTTLIEAFKSTLAEINGADLVVHVMDASSSEISYQKTAVEEILEQIGADRIERIEVLNKSDLLDDVQKKDIAALYPEAFLTSAETGDGIEAIIARIGELASVNDTPLRILIPYSRGDLTAAAHARCYIENEEHTLSGTLLTLHVPQKDLHLFKSFEIT